MVIWLVAGLAFGGAMKLFLGRRKKYNKRLIITLKGSVMQLGEFEYLLSQVGKGILIGLGIGAAFLGVAFLLSSWKEQQSLNIGALLAILSGSLCILSGLKRSKKNTVAS